MRQDSTQFYGVRHSLTYRTVGFSPATTSLQQAIEPLVGGFAFGFGEVVRGVGRDELQPIFGLEPRLDFLGLRECLFA